MKEIYLQILTIDMKYIWLPLSILNSNVISNTGSETEFSKHSLFRLQVENIPVIT